MDKLNKFVSDKKRDMVTLIAILLIYAFFAIRNSSYVSLDNLLLIFQQATINGIIAIGMTFAILTGGIDLSVGAVYAIIIVTAAQMTVTGFDPVLASLVCLVLGALTGLLNGLLVTKMNLQPFIATLGTMSVFRGIAYVVTGGVPITGVPDSFRVIFGFRLAKGIYVYILIFLILAVLMSILLRTTRFGNYLYAVGGNEEAAKLSGVDVTFVKIGAYVACAFCAALAGLICLSNLGSGNPAAGQGYELDAIAACAIGGSRMSGGKGTILGTFLGAILLATLKVGMIVLNVDTFYQYIVTGLVIIVAAFLEVIQTKIESRMAY